MHVFLTGATGFIGSGIVTDLLGAGHQVTGLARSPEKAKLLEQAGAASLVGSLDDLNLLKSAAADADAVIHTAFGHDFTKFAENCQKDTLAIEAMGAALKGTTKPLIATAGAAMITPGRAVTEEDALPPDFPFPRRTEFTTRALAADGVRAATVRLGLAHGVGDQGFLKFLIALAREKKVSAYLGDGQNRWSGVQRDDAARLFRLIVEQGATKPVYHAAAEEGIPFKDIASAIGRGLGVPVEPRDLEHFDWFAGFAGIDMPEASQLTQEWTGWKPAGIGLITDLQQSGYFD